MADDGWDEIIETEEFFEDLEELELQDETREEQRVTGAGQPRTPAVPRAPRAAVPPRTRAEQAKEEYDTPETRRGMGCLTVCLIICGVCVFALILDAIINGI